MNARQQSVGSIARGEPCNSSERNHPEGPGVIWVVIIVRDLYLIQYQLGNNLLSNLFSMFMPHWC